MAHTRAASKHPRGWISRQAEAAALAFRHEYEQAVAVNQPFDASAWKDWRQRLHTLQMSGVDYAQPRRSSPHDTK